MRYIADFILDSDLCFSKDSKPFVLSGPEQSVSITLSNADKDPKFPNSVLSAHLVFDAEVTEEDLREIAFSKLTDALNCLAFATSRKFVPIILKRIINWTPGLTERNAIIFAEQAEWCEPEPLLDPFVDSAERFLAMLSGAEQKSALRWYRLGVEADNHEEQFSYFWFALEIIAEQLKGPEKVASKCPKCQSDLYCETCQTHPQHRRYPGEAIRHLVEKVRPTDGGQIFRTLSKIRHTLLHGGRISSIQDDLPEDEQKIVTTLAGITWHAIRKTFNKPDLRPNSAMQLGYVHNIVRRRMIVAADVSVTMKGDPNNPKIEDFPKFNADITITRRETPQNEKATGEKV